jgi:hypothetical protein
VTQMLTRLEQKNCRVWKARTMAGDVRMLRVRRVDEDRSEVKKLWGRWGDNAVEMSDSKANNVFSCCNAQA